jgi:hypothetical protein
MSNVHSLSGLDVSIMPRATSIEVYSTLPTTYELRLIMGPFLLVYQSSTGCHSSFSATYISISRIIRQSESFDSETDSFVQALNRPQSLWFQTKNLHVVVICIVNECRIISGRILRPKTRFSVISTSRFSMPKLDPFIEQLKKERRRTKQHRKIDPPPLASPH